MFLRRLAAALKRQDWATVLIEFILVVSGVLFALQVNNWAQEAGERDAEEAALERLFLEAKNAHANVTARLEGTQRINRIRRNAVAFIDSDAPLPENTLPIKVGVNTMAQYPPMVVVDVVYDELKSSGQLQLIHSTEIRDAISTFYADIESYNVLLNGFGNSSDDFWEAYRRLVTWRYNAEATDADIILSTYDWEAMRQDKEFILIIIGRLRNHIVAENFLLAIEEKARTMCDRLGEALGKTCVEEAAATGP